MDQRKLDVARRALGVDTETEAIDQALDLDPASVAAWSRKAQAWLELGDRARARDALEHALALAPERIDLRQRLAELEGAA